MSKVICLMLCVVAASLRSVNSHKTPTLRDFLQPILDECMKKFDVTQGDINRAVKTGNPNIIPPPYNGCVFQKSFFIDKNGEYDLEGGMAYLRPLVVDEEQYAALYRICKECTSENVPVGEGDPASVRGERLSACILGHRDETPL